MSQTPAKRITSRGDAIDYTAAANVAAGDVIEIGSQPMIATQAIVIGCLGSLACQGVFDVPKTADIFTVGDAVYWYAAGTDVGSNTGAADNTTGNVMGRCVQNANAAATHVRVKLTTMLGLNTVAGSVTVDDITGGDTSLGITGAAGTGGAAGAPVVIAGGKGNATYAGGAVSLTGGVGNTTGDGGAASLNAGASGAGATGNGGVVTIVGGASGATTGYGGAITLAGGLGKNTGVGGAISVTGGQGGEGATGNGGAASLIGGAANSSNGYGGAIIVTGGLAKGVRDGGAITVTAGQGGEGATGNGGAVTIVGGAGNATTGNGGAMAVRGGAAAVAGGTGGALTLLSGAGDVSNGTAGAVVLDSGAGATKGTITIGTNAASLSIKKMPRLTGLVGSVSAAGANQATAGALLEGVNLITNSNNAKGVVLPSCVDGAQCVIINMVTDKTLLIYPPSGKQINLAGADNAITVAANTIGHFYSEGANAWYGLIAATDVA